MATYSWAQLPDWSLKTQKRLDVVVKQSTHDVIALASQTAPAKARGGSVQPGFVPRDSGFLAASLQSSLNGSTALTGEGSYVMAVAGMKAGDVAEFGWTAVYARAVHYRGWLWVDHAANQWQAIVADVVKRAMAQVQ